MLPLAACCVLLTFLCGAALCAVLCTELCAVHLLQTEIVAKYGEEMFDLCTQLFMRLPLGAMVPGTAFVVHGGPPGCQGYMDQQALNAFDR